MIYDSNKEKKVSITKAVEYMDEDWLDQNNCTQTTIDLVKESKKMLNAIKLGIHKIEQTLEGQYKEGQALVAALKILKESIQ